MLIRRCRCDLAWSLAVAGVDLHQLWCGQLLLRDWHLGSRTWCFLRNRWLCTWSHCGRWLALNCPFLLRTQSSGWRAVAFHILQGIALGRTWSARGWESWKYLFYHFVCHFSVILALSFFVIPKFYLSLFCHFSAIFLSCFCHFSVICLVIFLSFLNPTCHCSVIFYHFLLVFFIFHLFSLISSLFHVFSLFLFNFFIGFVKLFNGFLWFSYCFKCFLCFFNGFLQLFNGFVGFRLEK